MRLRRNIAGVTQLKRHAVNWGLVLSGGAACGLANIGVLEVLAEYSMAPEAIAGSSMGAIIAALHAVGHSPADMHAVAGPRR